MTTWYVAPGGSDSNPGTEGSPFLTIDRITHAGTSLVAGDTVIVEDGVYSGAHGTTSSVAELERNGSVGNPITLRARNKWGAKITADTGAPSIGFSFRGAVTNWVIDGFEMYGFAKDVSGSAGGIDCFAGGASSIIRNNKIHDIGRICTLNPQGQFGVFVERADITIEKNIIYNIGRLRPEEGGSCYGGSTIYQTNDHGIYYSAGNNGIIRNNLLYSCKSGWAIQCYANARTGMHIVNNTFADGNPDLHRSFIVLLAGFTTSEITNNIFYDAVAGAPIHNDSQGATTSLTIDYNVTTGAAMLSAAAQAGITVGANNRLATDARLVASPSNLHLTAVSPAINAGLALPSVVTDDFDGIARPQAGAYDVGAYEFGGESVFLTIGRR